MTVIHQHDCWWQCLHCTLQITTSRNDSTGLSRLDCGMGAMLLLLNSLQADDAARMMMLTNLLGGVGCDRGEQGHHSTSFFCVCLVVLSCEHWILVVERRRQVCTTSTCSRHAALELTATRRSKKNERVCFVSDTPRHWHAAGNETDDAFRRIVQDSF